MNLLLESVQDLPALQNLNVWCVSVGGWVGGDEHADGKGGKGLQALELNFLKSKAQGKFSFEIQQVI
jgi:hypothetical protein